MLDHITLKVHDLAASKAFYAAALAPIGYKALMEFPDSVGLGAGMPDFWLAPDPEARAQHLAFQAPSREAVDAFHAAAMAAGGRDNGAPGVRANYHPHYYAAFIYDPTGHNIEVVVHTPPGAPAKKAAPRKAAARKVAAKKKAKPAKKKGGLKGRRLGVKKGPR
jgi:catechol 2,3-dioxygenase-like lactoylglutathione lyase family enzyme